MEKRWYAVIAACLAAGMIVNGCGQPAIAPSGEKKKQNENAASASETQETETEPDGRKTEEGAAPAGELLGASESEEGYRLADDYYEYMNHTFLEDVEAPADSSQWNYVYELENTVQEILDRILMDTVADREQHEPGSGEQKITDFYLTAMDTEEREAAGFGELAMYLDRIAGAGTVLELLESAAWIGKELKLENLFTLIPKVDIADAGRYAVYLLRPDLGPGKAIPDAGSRAGRLEEYTSYVSDILKIYGEEESLAESRAAEIVAFQKAISDVSLPDEDMWNPELVNNRFTGEELQELFEGIDIKAVLAAAGIDTAADTKTVADTDIGADTDTAADVTSDADIEVSRYIVMEPEAERCLAAYLTEENLPLLKDYSVFCLIDGMAPYLAPSIRDRKLAYEQGGEPQDEQLAIEMTQDLFADEFGRLYVENCFPEEDKRGVKAMAEKITAEYMKRIENISWLDDSTKEIAKNKLERMDLKVGYPDKWPANLETADILPKEEGGSLVHNVLEIIRARSSNGWEMMSGPVDRMGWQATPQTVAVYYDPLRNELILPAAILQAPYYDKHGTEAENLGGIGTVIAHEVVHAFDAAGSLYDEYGNSAAWWTDKDYENYKEKEDAIAEYYSAIETFDGGHIDGRHTLRENIADLGAIACVTAVLDEAADEETGGSSGEADGGSPGEVAGGSPGEADDGSPGEADDGSPGEADDGSPGEAAGGSPDEETERGPEALRQMYERYAQTRAWKSAAGNGLAYKSSDDRSPAKVRVNAVLSASDGFYEAYPGIGASDEMYVMPQKRVGIW